MRRESDDKRESQISFHLFVAIEKCLKIANFRRVLWHLYGSCWAKNSDLANNRETGNASSGNELAKTSWDMREK